MKCWHQESYGFTAPHQCCRILCKMPPVLQWESLETVLIITVGEPYITALVLGVENEVNSSTIPSVLEF